MLTSIRGLLAVTALSGAFLATPAFADDAAPPAPVTITGSVAIVSDYRFRGVSNSDGDPAIQGGITLNSTSGFYVGAWSSSTSFTRLGTDAIYGSQELDLFAGYTKEVSPGVTIDAGLLYYAYPNGHVGDAEFFEPYASVAVQAGPAKLKFGGNYAWKQDALGGGDNLYLYTSVDIGVPNTPITVSGKLGYQDGYLAADFSDLKGFDWSIGASATVLGKVSIGVAYIGAEGTAFPDITDDTVVGTLSVAF